MAEATSSGRAVADSSAVETPAGEVSSSSQSVGVAPAASTTLSPSTSRVPVDPVTSLTSNAADASISGYPTIVAALPTARNATGVSVGEPVPTPISVTESPILSTASLAESSRTLSVKLPTGSPPPVAVSSSVTESSSAAPQPTANNTLGARPLVSASDVPSDSGVPAASNVTASPAVSTGTLSATPVSTGVGSSPTVSESPANVTISSTGAASSGSAQVNGTASASTPVTTSVVNGTATATSNATYAASTASGSGNVNSSSSAWSASSSSMSSSTSSDPYAWVPTSTLMVNRPTSSSSTSSSSSSTGYSSEAVTTASPTASPSQGVSTSMVSGSPSVTITSQASFPTDLPSRIVPDDTTTTTTAAQPQASAGAMQMAASTVPVTTISILLDDSMPWTWVVDNSDASGQIFYGVPIVVTNALNISLSSLKTVALQAYQTTNSSGASDILTVYLGQLPSTYVDALSAMLQTPTSPIYNQPGLPGQLAQTFIPSFSVKSFASEKATPDKSSSLDDGASDDSGSGGLAKSTKIIIAVVVTGGVILIAIASYFAWRATRTGAVKLSSPRVTQRDFAFGGGGGSGEMSQQAGGGLRSFHLGGSPTGSPYGTWRSGNSGRRDSISTTSTASTASSAYGPGRSAGSYGSGAGSGSDDRRSSWWRFSDHSSNGGHTRSSGAGFGGSGHVGLALGGGDSYREGPRRVQIMRGPNGSVAPGIIGR